MPMSSRSTPPDGSINTSILNREYRSHDYRHSQCSVVLTQTQREYTSSATLYIMLGLFDIYHSHSTILAKEDKREMV